MPPKLVCSILSMCLLGLLNTLSIAGTFPEQLQLCSCSRLPILLCSDRASSNTSFLKKPSHCLPTFSSVPTSHILAPCHFYFVPFLFHGPQLEVGVWRGPEHSCSSLCPQDQPWARQIPLSPVLPHTSSPVKNLFLVAEQELLPSCCSVLPLLLPRMSGAVGEGGTEKALPCAGRICRHLVLLLYKILRVDLQIFNTAVTSTKVERLWKGSSGPNIFQGKRGRGQRCL